MNLFICSIKNNTNITSLYCPKLYALVDNSEVAISQNLTVKNDNGKIIVYNKDELIESATVENYIKIIHEEGIFIINYNKIESGLMALHRIGLYPTLTECKLTHILINDTIKTTSKRRYILYNINTKKIQLFNERHQDCICKSYPLYKVVY